MDLLKLRPVNLYRLTKITESTENTIEFCKDVGLLPKSVTCPTCSGILTKPYYVKNRKSTQIHYQCNKRLCCGSGKKNTVSLRTKNWFSRSNLTMQKSLFMTYSFVHQLSYKYTMWETSISTKCEKGLTKVLTTSTETICDYKRYCRDICFQVLQDNCYSQIGGTWITCGNR